MRKSQLSIAIGLALLAVSAVHAQGAQGYVGGGVGWTNIAVDCSDIDQCDKSGTGGKLYAGYRFANRFAVEAVYINWGKATGQMSESVLLPANGRVVPLDTVPITLTESLELKATGVGIGVAYFMPLATDWNGVARLGAMRTDGKLNLTVSAQGLSESVSETKKSTFAYFGLGVGYNLTPNLVLTGEADFSRVKYGFEGEYETDNVRLISIGLRYAF
ncbi:MAG: outer membrane beta-barrel protein [Rubrivivax sp.]|nr:outer membrane beta-barrel protein [Rubrivivax sp.]